MRFILDRALFCAACLFLLFFFITSGWTYLLINQSKDNPDVNQKNCIYSMIGVVTEIGSAWTSNGDGYISVQVDDKVHKVNIVGWPTNYFHGRTVIQLETEKYIQNIVGKKVEVLYPVECEEVTAILLKEIK
jgi:DNA polymerase III alpha subunit